MTAMDNKFERDVSRVMFGLGLITGVCVGVLGVLLVAASMFPLGRG